LFNSSCGKFLPLGATILTLGEKTKLLFICYANKKTGVVSFEEESSIGRRGG
jgi:hypothetical protein